MNRTRLFLIAIGLFVVTAFIVSVAIPGGQRTTAPKSAERQAAQRAAAVKVEDSVFIIDGEPIGMTNGYAIVLDAPDSAATVTRIFGVPVLDDLDGDSDLDAAVMLSKSVPGSGTFYYVAASIKETSGYRGTEAFLLGDRVAPQNVEVNDGLITANYADRQPGEPMTTRPSVGVSKYLRVQGGELKEVPKP